MHVEGPPAGSAELMLRAASLELERRLNAGDHCAVEDLQAHYPELWHDAEALLELIFTEFVLRQRRGEQPSRDAWYARFPERRERLERLFNVHEMFAADTSLAAGETPRPEAAPRLDSLPRLADYELLAEVGRGGMGVVYRARQVELNRIVALKLILAGEHAGTEQRGRFRREAEAAARLQHPGIVQIYDIGQEGDLPYLAMEYIDGPRLDQVLAERCARDGTGLAPPQAARLLAALARGIHHAHQHGVVHRDLKPANILLPLEEASCKITDFGLAKTLNDARQETRSGVLVGTPSYMAPEQAAGRSADVGPASDIFALGVILYELLAGRLPFQAPTVAETLEQVRTLEPPALRRLRPDVPRDVETICMMCLQKEPSRRYGSAELLAEDLDRFLRDEPIAARPVGRVEKAWRWCRRNPAVAALTAGIALLLLSAAAVAGALAVWALHERSQAQAHAAQEGAARARAEHHFEQAESAVKKFLDDVENHPRLKQADFHDLRKQLLASALPYYEDFVRQQPGDEDLEAKRGRAYYRLAMLRGELGEHQAALADYRRMQSIFRALATQSSRAADYRLELARSHNNATYLLRNWGKPAEAAAEVRQALAELEQADSTRAEYRKQLARSHAYSTVLAVDQGQWAQAEPLCRRALELQQALTRDFPGDPDCRHDLARTHNNLAIVLFRLGWLAPAAAEYRAAIALAAALAAEFPDHPEYRFFEAQCHTNLGVLLHQLGKDPAAAALEHRQAIAILEPLSSRFPRVAAYQEILAMAHYNHGLVLAALRQPALALDEYRASVTIYAALVALSPGVPQYRHVLGGALNNLGNLLGQRGEHDEARRLFEQAIAHQLLAYRTAPANPVFARSLQNHYRHLATVTLRQKDHVATAEAAAQLVAVRPDVADDALMAARFCGRCVVLAEEDQALPLPRQKQLARAYADAAMQHLREAVRRGFNDTATLTSVTALAPLRRRADFQALIQGRSP